MSDDHHRRAVATPSHFSSLSSTYALQTGNSTADLFNTVLPRVQALHPLTSSSVVHDNAAGPGSASAAILASLKKEDWPREILITDNNADMIQNAADAFKTVEGVECKVLDSQELEGLVEGRYTHSIMNVSLFLLKDPVAAMARVHSTLQPSGLAVITTWSRFGAAHIIHAAQRAIRPDLPLMPVPPPHFASLEYLEETAEKAGFERAKIETFSKSVVVEEGKWLDGLRGFFRDSPLAKMARRGWSGEDEDRWMDEIEKAVQEELKEYGGVFFEGAVMIARK